jgi:MFS family permease
VAGSGYQLRDVRCEDNSMRKPRHCWIVLAFTVIAQAVIYGALSYSFAFWVVPWLDEFKVPRSELMLAITLSLFTAGAMSPFAGAALDKFPTRVLFCLGATSFAIGLALISFARSHWLIVGLYGVMLPIGTVLSGSLACQTMIMRWFPSNRGSALGVSALGVSLGAFATPPFATYLLGIVGWRHAFQVFGLLTFFVIVPAGWVILKQTPRSHEMSLALTSPDRNPWSTRLLLRSADFWIISVAFAALLIAFMPVLYNVGAFARDLGISQQHAAVAMSCYAIAAAIGKAGFGRLADKVEHRYLYWLAGGMMIASIGIVAEAKSIAQLVSGLLLAGLSFGSYFPLLGSMMVSRFGAAAFGRSLGLSTLIIQSSALAPYLAGVVREFSGSYVTAFLSMSGLLVPAMIAMRSLSSRPTEQTHTVGA